MEAINFKKKPFSPEETKVIGQKPSVFAGRPGSNIYNTPISYRENALSLFWDKKPVFAVGTGDFSGLSVDWYQKNLGRSGRNEPGNCKIDAFGVKWTYEPTAGGSISVGGNPRFTDANDWKDVIKMPDVNDWDWAADAAAHIPDTRFAVEMTPVNGFWFERLISFMDFMNAAVALVDDEQTDALHELFEATTQLACDIVDKVCEYWPCCDGFMFHDDWGSQKDPFFSDTVARELFLPHMKKVVDHVHAKGRYFGLHSCGHVEARVPVFIEAGIDTWQMQDNANHVDTLYEEFGDQIILQVSLPAFDINDEKKCVEMAHFYVDNYLKPGKPTMLKAREALASPVFAEEVYAYSRKKLLEW